MLNFNVRDLLARSISRGMAPRNAAMLQVVLDFGSDTEIRFSADLSPTIQNKWGIAGVQSVKIDNRNNSDVLILSFDNGEVIVCPSYAQGIFPVLFSGDILSFTAYTSTSISATLTFINTREQAQLWAAKLPIAGTINVTGSTIYAEKYIGTWTDKSAALTTGGTAQLLMAANANRKTFMIRNPGTAASQNIAAPEPVFIYYGSGYAVNDLGTWELFPGEQMPLADLITTQAIYFNAATTGHRLTAWEM